MARKRKNPVEKGVEELILKTVKEAKDQERGPGADKLLAIARLLNSYARLRGGGNPPHKVRDIEGLSEQERFERQLEIGDPLYYDSLSE